MAEALALVDSTSEQGLYIGADHTVVLTVYSNYAKTTIQEITGWTVVLDIRKKDTSTTSLLSKTGTISGTFNATPASNTQVCTFTLSDDDLASTVFTGDDPQLRYSIKRTDSGAEQPLRYGDVTLTRVTQV